MSVSSSKKPAKDLWPNVSIKFRPGPSRVGRGGVCACVCQGCLRMRKTLRRSAHWGVGRSFAHLRTDTKREILCSGSDLVVATDKENYNKKEREIIWRISWNVEILQKAVTKTNTLILKVWVAQTARISNSMRLIWMTHRLSVNFQFVPDKWLSGINIFLFT